MPVIYYSIHKLEPCISTFCVVHRIRCNLRCDASLNASSSIISFRTILQVYIKECPALSNNTGILFKYIFHLKRDVDATAYELCINLQITKLLSRD